MRKVILIIEEQFGRDLYSVENQISPLELEAGHVECGQLLAHVYRKLDEELNRKMKAGQNGKLP